MDFMKNIKIAYVNFSTFNNILTKDSITCEFCRYDILNGCVDMPTSSGFLSSDEIKLIYFCHIISTESQISIPKPSLNDLNMSLTYHLTNLTTNHDQIHSLFHSMLGRDETLSCDLSTLKYSGVEERK